MSKSSSSVTNFFASKTFDEISKYFKDKKFSPNAFDNLPEEELLSVIDRINTSTETASLENIHTILDGLADAVSHKSSKPLDKKSPRKLLKENLDITRLITVFNNSKDLDITNVIGIIKDCSRLGYDMDEIGLDMSKLSDFILLHASQFNVFQAIHLVTSLTKLGYKDSPGLPISSVMHKMAHVINTEFMKSDNLFGCEASEAEMFDALFKIQSKTKKFLKDESITQLPSSEFNLFHTVSLIHALSQSAYAKDARDSSVTTFNKDGNTISDHFIKRMNRIKSKATADITHSFAKSGMLAELFDMQDHVTALLNEASIQKLPSVYAFSLLQAEGYCRVNYGDNFFDESTVKTIAQQVNKKCDEEHFTETKIEETLYMMGGTTERESSVCMVGGVSTRDVDIKCVINGKTYYIEIEGPQHYLSTADSKNVKNAATNFRDDFNKKLIAEIADDNTYYLSINVEDISQVMGQYDDLKTFLTNALQDAEQILPIEIEDNVLDVSLEEFEANEHKEGENMDVVSDAQIADRTIEGIISDYSRARNAKSKRHVMSEISRRFEEVNEDGKGMLHLAIENELTDLVLKLIAQGAAASTQDSVETVLHTAVRTGSPASVMHALLDHAVDGNAVFEGKTPLEEAVIKGDISHVKILASRTDPQIVDDIMKRYPDIDNDLDDALKTSSQEGVKIQRLETLFFHPNPKQVSLVNMRANDFANSANARKILDRAYEENRLDIVCAMVEKGVPLTEEELYTKFEQACVVQDVGLIEAFLVRGVDVERELPQSKLSPVELFIKSGSDNVECINALISAGAKINGDLEEDQASDLVERLLIKTNSHLEEVIHQNPSNIREIYTAIKGHTESILCALFEKYDFQHADQQCAICIATNLGSTKLIGLIAGKESFDSHTPDVERFIASTAHNLNVETFDALLRGGIDLKQVKKEDLYDILPYIRTYKDGNALNTVLTYIKESYPDEIGKVIKDLQKMVPNMVPFALKVGNEELLNTLLDLGFEPDTVSSNKMNSLQAAVHVNSARGVDILLSYFESRGEVDQKLNEVDKNGWNALHNASKSDHEDVVDVLLAHHSDPASYINSTNPQGITALHIAAARGCINVANVLLRHPDLDIAAVEENNDNALIYAVMSGYENSFETILEAVKKRPDSKDIIDCKSNNHGSSALIIATHSRNDKMVKQLLDADADVNSTNNDNATSLHIAASKGDEKVTNLLLQHPLVDVGCVTKSNQTALDLAVEKEHKHCYEALLEAVTHRPDSEDTIDRQSNHSTSSTHLVLDEDKDLPHEEVSEITIPSDKMKSTNLEKLQKSKSKKTSRCTIS